MLDFVLAHKNSVAYLEAAAITHLAAEKLSSDFVLLEVLDFNLSWVC